MAESQPATCRHRPQTSTAAFKALAHPMRVKMLHELGRAPATATSLAEKLGESTGSTSYHLRQLARHGLIVEDPELGNARERWWTPAPSGVNVSPEMVLANPQAGSVLLDSTLAEWHVEAAEGFRRALSRAGADDGSETFDLLSLSRWGITGTPDELRQLYGRIEEILEPHLTSRAPAESHEPRVRMTVQLIAFPKD